MNKVSKKLLLNQLINISWTTVAFAPVLVYYSGGYVPRVLYIFLAVSLASGLLPARIFDLLQLSSDPQFYRRIGVLKIRNFVQDGDLINRSIRQELPGHRIIRNKSSLSKYMKTIDMYERFHFICLIFFLLTALLAFRDTRYYLGIIITAGNFLYNVCPILLQQYNKLKVSKLIGKS